MGHHRPFNSSCLAFLLALSSSTTLAATSNQCPVDNNDQPLTLRAKDAGIEVMASRAVIQQNKLAQFDGDVQIITDSAQIKANTAKVDKQRQSLDASGDIRFVDPQIKVNCDRVKLDYKQGQLTMDNTEYRMLGFTGRGEAGRIELSQKQGIKLVDASFSTCPAGQEDWQLKASSIEIRPNTNWGVARNTRFYMLGVPVFYLPYFRFPVTEERQSGLLYPQISSSSSTGLSIEQPYYWNIAPNYDATISPRLMANRGLQLKTEFRYLTGKSQGQVNLEYLQHDRQSESNPKRYMYRWIQHTQLDSHWQANINLNGISDNNYIVDLGSAFYNRADTHLTRNAGLQYRDQQWFFSAYLRDFQLIGNHPDGYRAMPEFKLNYTTPWTQHLDFDVHSELTYFDGGSQSAPAAARLHIAPSLLWHQYANWGEFSAQTTLLQTNYYQKDAEQYGLKQNVSRTLGRVRLYGAINLERDSNWFGQGGRQTLEPKFQYLYTTYQNQNDIGLYDTTRLQNNFAGLFRGQEFTGLDRISDTNQVTLGLTSRFLDGNDQEKLRLSLGQIFYLADNRVLEAHKDNNRSALAAELDWRTGQRWYLHSEIQLASSAKKLDKSSLSLEYRAGDNKLVQLTHRFVRELSGERIDQVGVTASWKLYQNWQWVGRWYKDMTHHRTIESYTGIEYSSCCWAIQFVAQRFLNNRFEQSGNIGSNNFDSGIALKFIFRGMGGGESARALLNDGLFGYRQPYFLNE